MRSGHRAAAMACKKKDPKVVRRLLAVATGLAGKSCTNAALRNGMQRQTLCD